MSNISYYTEEGLKKLKDELNHLKDVERPKASNAIAEELGSKWFEIFYSLEII